jgi:hypothetical protein
VISSRLDDVNEMYAALVAAAGCAPVLLTGADYLELLPACQASCARGPSSRG